MRIGRVIHGRDARATGMGLSCRVVLARLFRLTAVVLVLFLLGFGSLAPAQEDTKSEKSGASQTENDIEDSRVAPVELDGNGLFSVRGSIAFPAEERAAAIAARIRAVAADPSISPGDVRAVELDHGVGVFAANQRLMMVFDADAKIAAAPQKPLADFFASKIQNAITQYRQARTRPALLRSAGKSVAATVILVGLLALIIWFSRLWHRLLEGFYRKRIHSVGIQSFKVVRAEQIRHALQRVIDIGRILAILAAGIGYLQYVLGQFPWTRATSLRMRGYLLGPLETMATGILRHIPAIIFLVFLYLITRFALRLLHKFFDALKTGDVKFSGFDPEWADSTYKLIRLGVVILALIVAYPYIPGGDSEAFKGISIFIGIVFSLGSSSAIANLIAGYLMTYRRAFHLGDRIKIGDTLGDVAEMRLQVTHLRTLKNEEVIIPNSSILNNEVVNYSSLARQGGLILHTTVSIGYQTSWRQVEAMLLLAASRTNEIMTEPPPFVLQRALGDFAITYEINVYCDNAQAMARIYTALHQNILDLFNEYAVQIMTPAYESDPKMPKVVPKEHWFSAPASVPNGG